MNAQSFQCQSVAELKQELANNITVDFIPTLAIVFSSVVHDRKEIGEIFSEAKVEVFGVTTNGEFIDENHNNKSIAVLLLDLPKDAFKVQLSEYPDKNYREVARSVAEKAKAQFSDPAFILGISHAAVDGEDILLGLQDIIGMNVNAFGGAAGDDFNFIETFVFTNQLCSNQALICLILDQSKVQVEGIATCGWKAVGTEKTVTKSEGNHVFTIDNEPAATITAKYGGLTLNPESQDTLIELASNFPLQLQKEKGDPVMRPGLVVDWEDMSFYTSGKVPQGSKVRFSVPPDWDVMDKVVQGVQELKETRMPDADAVVVFSCAGRLLSFGPMMTEEIEGVKGVYDAPIIGMFSNAELGRMSGGNLEMHNITTCAVALKER